MYGRRNVFTPKRRRPVGRYIALAVLLAIILCGVYAVVDNGRIVLKTQRVMVSNLPKNLEGFTILHISDLNGKRFGPEQKHIANLLKNKKYSAVCITGDMIGPKGDTYPFMELLSALDVSKPVYFVPGDSDPVAVGGSAMGYYSVLAEWVLLAQQTRGAIFLGPPASIEVGGSTVWFTDASQLALDLETAAAAYANSTSDTSTYSAEVIALTQAARARMKDGDLHIMLSHKPLSQELVLRIQNMTDPDGITFVRTVDLVLAGSTVGGQWRLPFVGPVWSENWFPPDSQTRGYYSVSAGIPQYITGGLGTNPKNPLPDFRLFNTPEMTLITFTSEMDDDSLPAVM